MLINQHLLEIIPSECATLGDQDECEEAIGLVPIEA